LSEPLTELLAEQLTSSNAGAFCLSINRLEQDLLDLNAENETGFHHQTTPPVALASADVRARRKMVWLILTAQEGEDE
jgi:hypothetical protein